MNARSLVLALLLVVTAAAAAESPNEAHGSADVYAAPGVALAWGILRGPSEAATSVIIRIVADPKIYSWVVAAGIDPFTRTEHVLHPATPVGAPIDVQVPRARFADLPRTEIRLYDETRTAQSGAPNLTIFYLGVPDTTPEFADQGKLDAYLSDRISRARSGAGRKAP